jgi:hypothetical protein
MRIALVAGSVPNPTAGGATLTTWTAAKYFLEQGHEVVVVMLGYDTYTDPQGETLEAHAAALEAIGGRLEVVPSRSSDTWSHLSTAPRARLHRLLRPAPELLFPTLVDRAAMDEALRRVAPDAILAYHWESLAATHGTRVAPRLGVVVDPHHLPILYRWRASLRRPNAWTYRMLPVVYQYLRASPRTMTRLLRDCEAATNLAAHHAAWFRAHGVPDCSYMRTPVPDPFAEGETRTRSSRRERPALLLMGHLKGTSTTQGLKHFGRDVLPLLDEALGADGFEVRIVGGYEPGASLLRHFDHPAVRFCGHTSDPGAEFLDADMMVVPTPIKLGTRVRILSAFSYGCPVVAHQANALGIPELEHGRNVVLGGSAKELAAGIVDVARDATLHARLEKEGRETFERFFSPPVAAGAMLDVLQALGPQGPG